MALNKSAMPGIESHICGGTILWRRIKDGIRISAFGCHVNDLRWIFDMDEKVYFTYIVASRSHILYIGMTGDLLKRFF